MSIASDSNAGKETPTATAEETPPEATGEADTPARNKGGDTPPPEPFSASDADIERAVKAGLSLADAKAIPDKAMFERVCEALEKKAAPEPKTVSDDGKTGDDDSAGDDEIPTLPEDEDYDPKLVAAFNKMGQLLKQTRDENAALKKAGTTAEAQTFFDTQFGNLEEAVRSKVDDAGREKLKQKFEMLEAGYKATGAKLSREDIFNEAARLEIGDLMREAGAATKAEKLAERGKVRLNPPTGENRSGAARKSEEDIDNDVARLISEKFNI